MIKLKKKLKKQKTKEEKEKLNKYLPSNEIVDCDSAILRHSEPVRVWRSLCHLSIYLCLAGTVPLPRVLGRKFPLLLIRTHSIQLLSHKQLTGGIRKGWLILLKPSSPLLSSTLLPHPHSFILSSSPLFSLFLTFFHAFFAHFKNMRVEEIGVWK